MSTPPSGPAQSVAQPAARASFQPGVPIGVAIGALGVFGVMDGVMKAAAIAIGAYPAMVWRSLAGIGLMLPLWWWRAARRHGLPGRAALRLHALRGAVCAVMTVLFFHGLARTPMAEAIALSFIAPLIALYLAAAMLGERVGGRAIAGSVIAFGGVAVIAQGKFAGAQPPGAVAGLLAILASAVLYAWNLVLQRRQAQQAGPEEVAFFQTLFVFLLLVPGSPWFAPWPPGRVWGLLAVAAALSAISIMLLAWAYARAEAQVLVPMEYTAFVWAALVGWLWFAEVPDWRTLVGVALIVCGCLVAARRVAEEHLEAAIPPG